MRQHQNKNNFNCNFISYLCLYFGSKSMWKCDNYPEKEPMKITCHDLAEVIILSPAFIVSGVEREGGINSVEA